MNQKQVVFFISVVMLFSAFFFGCDKRSDVGIGLIPDNYKIKTNAIDTFRVLAYTHKVDSLVTRNITKGLLGSYIDPFFGEVKASFVTEILPSGTPKFGGADFDSIVMYLRYDTIVMAYGDRSAEDEINIFEINERVHFDSTYYHNFDPATLNPTLITSSSFRPDDVIDTDSLLSIRLSDDFGTRLFNDSSTWSDTTFATYFNGFLVTSNANAIDGAISLFNLSHADSRISIFYHNSTDTLEYKFNINQYTTRFNLYEHKHNALGFLPDLENPESKEDSVIYIQGAGGLRAKILLPYLDQLSEQGVWGVNRAKLILSAESKALTSEDLYPAPEELILLSINDKGQLVYLDEYYSNTNPPVYRGAVYSDNHYIFDITFLVQKILQGESSNNGFMLMLRDGSVNPSRVVLTGGKHSNNMKLVLTLTKLSDK